MRIVSILMMAVLCQSGLGQSISTEEFRLDRKYQNSEIVQYEEPRVSPYSLDLARELAIFGIGNALLGMGLLLSRDLDPLTQDEVAKLDPLDVNKFDRATITSKQKWPAGDLLLLSALVLPLTFLTHDETSEDLGRLAVMAGEVFVFQLGLNSVIKGLVERPRPYTYSPDTSLEIKTTVNAKLSFYSGHTSTASSMSFFVAKVFSDYLESPATKTVIWTAAALYPALTGFLRIESGNHFRTDVIIGYVVGALVGYFIPVLHKSKLKDNLTIHSMVLSNRVAFGVSYRF